MLKIIILILVFALFINSQQLPNENFLQQSLIEDKGYQYGLDMLNLLIEYRKEYNIFKSITHQSSLQSIVESQVKSQVDNPEKFAQHEGFEQRSEYYQYYSEFVTKLVLSNNPANDALTMWKQNDDSKDDLLSDFNEGAGYCHMFGDGWLCELILVQTK